MTSHSLGWSEKDLHEHNTKQRTTISNTATIERVGTKLTICLHIAANTEMVCQTFFNEKRSTNLCRPIPSFRQNAQIFLSSLFSYRKHTQTHFTQLVAFHYSAFYYHSLHPNSPSVIHKLKWKLFYKFTSARTRDEYDWLLLCVQTKTTVLTLWNTHQLLLCLFTYQRQWDFANHLKM